MAWHHIALRLAECSGHDRARAWTIEADASKQFHFDAQSYQLLICTDFGLHASPAVAATVDFFRTACFAA